jgi:DNA primase
MPGLFSPATLEKIRAASDIVDVVGSYLPLKRAGANFTALCPFHKEKTPSFSVNPQRQIFYCFGCHKGGDVFRFVQEFESITFPEAVKRMADRAKIPLEYEQGAGEQQSRHLKDQLLQIHEQITQRWQSTLANEAGGQIARDYLARRGVSAEAVKLFRLGAAPEAWDDTVNWAKSKGFEPALMEKAGLILRKEGSDHHYDRFRGRLIFPICDEQGRVIGFSGRVLSGDEKTAKYVNSPETPIFTKSKVFFGLDKSKRALLDAEFAVVCEGQLDLIACFMAGVQNIVAPQGTAFTADHARILKRYVDEVVLCFDSDEAGQNAAVRSLDHLLASGLAVRVAVVPAPHDPDSFIKANGGEAFSKLIEQADGFFDYYLNRLCATNDVSTDKGRLAVLSGMAEAVHKTGNAVLIDKYAQKTAFRLAVATDAVRREFKKSVVRGAAPDEAISVWENQTESFRQELWLLELLLAHEELVPWVAQRLKSEWLVNEPIRKLVSRCIELHASHGWTSASAFLAEFEDSLSAELITEALISKRQRQDPEAIIKGTKSKAGFLMILRDQWIDRELRTIQNKMAHPSLTELEQHNLVRQQTELRQLKGQPLSSPELQPSRSAIDESETNKE